jgi:hypothetical protein
VTSTALTPAGLLTDALRTDPARPLITFYDDATGERVELSVATFGNWVAKTANLIQDGLGAEPGDRLALLLPAHWQTAVWLLAAFSTGVVALALRPLGGRFPQPPRGFADYAVEVPGQGDRFVPYVPVGPDDPALELPGGELLTGGEVVVRARSEAEVLELSAGSRLLSGLRYDGWNGLAAGLLTPLAAGASVVLCRNLDQLAPEGLARRKDEERVTHAALPDGA